MKPQTMVNLAWLPDTITVYPGGPPSPGDMVGAWESLSGHCWMPPNGPQNAPLYSELGVTTDGEARWLAGYPISVPGGNPFVITPFDIWIVARVPDDGSVWMGHQSIAAPYIRVGPHGSEIANCGGAVGVGPGIGVETLNYIRLSERDICVRGKLPFNHGANIPGANMMLNTLLSNGINGQTSAAGVFVRVLRASVYSPDTDNQTRKEYRKGVETLLEAFLFG